MRTVGEVSTTGLEQLKWFIDSFTKEKEGHE